MLRKFKIINLFLFAFFGSLFAGQESATGNVEESKQISAEPLYLPVSEVIERVKSQNLQLLIRNENVRRALELSYQRHAALLPQFGLSAQQNRNQMAFNPIGGNLNANVAPFNSFGSRVEGNLDIIDPQNYSDYRLAKLTHAIEELDYEVAVQDLLDQAIMLYFTHLRDLRRIEIFKGNLEREQRLLDLAKQQFAAGVAVKIDVTRAEVRLSSVRRSLMEAEIDAYNSVLELKNLLDIDLDQALKLDHALVDGIKSPPTLKRYGQMARLTELRPELESQQTELDRAILAKRAVNWQRLPSVGFFAEWGYDANDIADRDQGEAWMIGVQASVPIWEGGRIAAERREASATVRQNKYAQRQLKNEIERQFKFALLEMDSRYAQIEIASDEVRLGNDEVEQARERYNEGLADNRELIDAQQRLADAENSHLRAIYLYGLSRLAFARSIGAVERVLE